MILTALLAIPFVFASVAAQSSPTVVCVAGQCLQGFSNITLGATLSAPNAAASVHLLPGQYASDTNPALLHQLLTSSSATLSPSPGFNGSSVSLPIDLALLPGIVTYATANYSGQASFTSLPTNSTANSSSALTTVSVGAVALSSNIWAAVSFGSSSNRIILWDSIPDISQVSSFSNALSVLDIQSAACSPPCAGAGICSAAGICSCPTGFTGSSCETCASGFFGSSCTACPAGCGSCDDGISGTGRCLVPTVSNPSSGCHCLNGVCGSNGQCACNAGWTTSSNGTACAKCADGFFLTSDGNCSACQLGCTQCADSTGDCTTCKSGFTQNANDRTQCLAVQGTTSSGTVCPDGSFSNGTACTACSPQCQTCNGPTSNSCIICGAGTFSLNGSCVSVDGNGVCEGSSMIADNNKHECDSCPSKCTKCGISNFNVASTVNQAQCTGCLPGFVLSQGQCVESCPTGTFLDPKDNLTCTTCDSTCSTCAGSSTFCLTCANNQLASSGKCVASCPSNTFSSSGACITCHPDCSTCSGSTFNQCSSCPSNRPVLTNGRCLPTCSQSQFFDKTSSTCQSCDSSCSSCSAAGLSNCLACSSSSQVLRSGTCVSASCTTGSVIPGLGLCLSDVVVVPPAASGTSAGIPLPTITGLDSPVPTTVVSSGRRTLAWWEILLMALGCAFIFVVVLMLWRRRARRLRQQRTAAFASAKLLNNKMSWRWRLMRFGERLFGHSSSKRAVHHQESELIGLEKMRAAEEARHERDMEKLVGAYEYSRAGSSRASSHHHYDRQQHLHDEPRANRFSIGSLSAGSLYSQVTGMPTRAPQPRQPVRNAADLLPSRFSSTTYNTTSPPERLPVLAKPPTPAQEYARSISANGPAKGSYWLEPTNTGASRNPFRR